MGAQNFARLCLVTDMQYSAKFVFICFLSSPAIASSVFWDELYSQPIAISVDVNSSENFTGYFKFSEGELRLLEVLEGDAPDNIINSLEKGIDYKACTKTRPCNDIYYANYNKYSSHLNILYHQNNIKSNAIRDSSSIITDTNVVLASDYQSLYLSNAFYVSENNWYSSLNYQRDDNTGKVRLADLYYIKKGVDYSLNVGLIDAQDALQGYIGNTSTGAYSLLGLGYVNEEQKITDVTKKQLIVQLPTSSYVSIFRGQNLIDSLVLDSGVNIIDTSTYPRANYPVSIIIKPRDGGEKYELTDYVYNGNVSSSYGMNIGLLTDSQSLTGSGLSKLYTSHYVNKNIFDTFDVGYQGEFYGENITLGLYSKYSSNNFLFQYQTKYEYQKSNEVGINNFFSLSYSEGAFFVGSTLTLDSLSDWYATSDMRYVLTPNDTFMLSYRRNENDEFGNIGLTYNTSYDLFSSKVRVHYGVNHSDNELVRNTSFFVKFAFDFNQSHGIDFNMNLSNSDGEQRNTYALGYSKDYDSYYLKRTYVNAQTDGENTSWLSQAQFEHPNFNGSLSLSGNSYTSSIDTIATMSSTIYSDLSNISASSEQSNAGVVINVVNESQLDETVLLSSVQYGFKELKTGRNFIPVQPGNELSIDLSTSKNNFIDLKRINSTLSEGEVVFHDVTILPSVTVVGRVVSRKPETSSYGLKIENHISSTYTDGHGMFVLDMSKVHPTIIIQGKSYQVDLSKAYEGVVYLDDIFI